jgi:sulfur-oxidizing protein SoxY
MKPLRRALLALSLSALALTLAAGPALAQTAGAPPRDPLDSVMWADLAERFFRGRSVSFDARITVQAPQVIEDQTQVPITVDASALGSVRRVMVFADLNPIPHVLTFTPAGGAPPFIAFRMKVEQATPVRAAAEMPDGSWRVGHTLLDAAGGGCSAPAHQRKSDAWASALGQVHGQAWRQGDGLTRLRLRLQHPMDTGLTPDNVPAFYISELTLAGAEGEPLGRLELFEPVAENPVLTVKVRLPAASPRVLVRGRDTDGNLIQAAVAAGWKQGQIDGRTDGQHVR